MTHLSQVVLVARRKDKLHETVSALQSSHLPAVGFPIAETVPQKANIPPATHGLILTSSAAVGAAKGSKLPCYCVGPKTAKAAERAGLQVIYIGSKGGRTLAQGIVDKFPPHTVCHITTPDAGTIWYTILERAGFQVKTCYGYETKYLSTLPYEVDCCFKENRVSSIMVFSSRIAEKTCDLLQSAGIALETVPEFLAISNQVANTLEHKGVHRGKIRVALTPTSEDIINVLEQSLKPEEHHPRN